jgi:hypothetical protein
VAYCGFVPAGEANQSTPPPDVEAARTLLAANAARLSYSDAAESNLALAQEIVVRAADVVRSEAGGGRSV